MPDRNGNLDNLDYALIIAKKTDRIKELEQNRAVWERGYHDLDADLKVAKQEVERLRKALDIAEATIVGFETLVGQLREALEKEARTLRIAIEMWDGEYMPISKQELADVVQRLEQALEGKE